MRTVSFQGAQLSSADRRRLALQQQVVSAALLNPALQNQLQAAIDKLEERKEQGAKPEKFWSVEYQSKGTLFLGDVFGHGQFIEV